MMRHTAFYVGLVLFVGLVSPLPSPFKEECVSNRYPPKNSTKVPTYTINLDEKPSERWSKLAADKAQGISALISELKTFLALFGAGAEKVLVDFIDNDMPGLVDTFPSPYGEELKALANVTKLPLGEILLYNMFYEVFSVCTSIVAQDSSGKLYHARNLDFGLFMGWDAMKHEWAMTEKLRPLVVNLEFTRGGKLLYRASTFAGYIGIVTAVKPGVFTLSLNERFDLLDGGYVGILKWIMGDHSAKWMGFLTRDAMEQAASYDDAKKLVSTAPMVSPAYFILGGNKSGQASIITRSRAGALDVWELNPANGTWYILETNYDHWKAPLFIDDRRTPANNCMKRLTQKNVSFSGLFDVLSSKPVLNKLTAYTTLMQVNSGKLETYLRECPDPCWPF